MQKIYYLCRKIILIHKTMKKTIILLLAVFFAHIGIGAENPIHEFRATWLTGNGIDWPKTTSVQSQKEHLCDIFRVMELGNMNAACLQVRSFCDALYKSSYEPWSQSLTGTRGGDPGYDPLAFAVEEAHKRGIELHILKFLRNCDTDVPHISASSSTVHHTSGLLLISSRMISIEPCETFSLPYLWISNSRFCSMSADCACVSFDGSRASSIIGSRRLSIPKWKKPSLMIPARFQPSAMGPAKQI